MAVEPKHPLDLSALSPLADEVAETMARVASDVALVIDSAGVIRRVAEGRSHLPAACTDWIGQRWVDTASSDSRRKIELLLDELQSTGVTQRREVNHPGGDGDDMPMAWTAIRLGASGPVVAVGRDLRAVAAIQRRFLDAQHEMELDYWQRRHADHRYRLMFQVARDAVLAIDAHSFEVLEANPAARALIGGGGASEAASVVGQALPILLPEGARAAAVELLRTARTVVRASEIPLRLAPTLPTASLSATPFRVGDRLQLLVRLRAADGSDRDSDVPSSMRAFVESTPDAVVITDSAGCIQLVNPAFLQLVQRSGEAQLKGKPLHEVVSDRDGHWRRLVARTRLQGLCTHVPLRVLHGALAIEVVASAALLADADQEHLGFTLRVAGRAERPATPIDAAWPVLSRLKAQVGLASLQELLHDGQLALERQLILTALRLGGARLTVAAQLLSLTADDLQARMAALGMAVGDVDDDDDDDNGNNGNNDVDPSGPPPPMLN